MTMNASGYPVLDEDNMASNSDTSISTQQSIKAYVDNSASTGGWTVAEETGTTRNLAVNEMVVCNNASPVTCSIPATVAVGQRFALLGKGVGGFVLDHQTGQTVHFDSASTTTGTGSITTTSSQYSCLEVVCITANTDFVVRNSVGSFTVA